MDCVTEVAAVGDQGGWGRISPVLCEQHMWTLPLLARISRDFQRSAEVRQSQTPLQRPSTMIEEG